MELPIPGSVVWRPRNLGKSCLLLINLWTNSWYDTGGAPTRDRKEGTRRRRCAIRPKGCAIQGISSDLFVFASLSSATYPQSPRTVRLDDTLWSHESSTTTVWYPTDDRGRTPFMNPYAVAGVITELSKHLFFVGTRKNCAPWCYILTILRIYIVLTVHSILFLDRY